jgi:hypothetical protein
LPTSRRTSSTGARGIWCRDELAPIQAPDAATQAKRRRDLQLCIGRGTLNAEERHVINDHVVQTMRMLAQLPFPKHLKRVPEIAGGHHEKLDGTGYPGSFAARS